MLITQDNLELAHRLIEIGIEIDGFVGWGHGLELAKLEEERSRILEKLGMDFTDLLLEEERRRML